MGHPLIVYVTVVILFTVAYFGVSPIDLGVAPWILGVVLSRKGFLPS